MNRPADADLSHACRHDVAGLSVVATGCMALAILICLIKLLATPGNKFSQTSLLLPPTSTFTTAMVGLLNLCFAFGGQVS